MLPSRMAICTHGLLPCSSRSSVNGFPKKKSNKATVALGVEHCKSAAAAWLCHDVEEPPTRAFVAAFLYDEVMLNL
jgi:hypothetical protein